MDWDVLGQVWAISKPWVVRAISQGENNLTQALDTPDGRFVLRTYGKDRVMEHIIYELQVVRSLQQHALSFHIPSPVPTVTGELFAVVSGTVVTLAPWLSGSPPHSSDAHHTQAAGQALAELQQARGQIQIDDSLPSASFPRSDDFAAWAGGSVNVAELVHDLPLARDQQKQIRVFLEATQRVTPTLYQTLPQQLMHRDYDQSNVLIDGDGIRGILDFEFCGYDLCVLDLTYALSQWPNGLWGTGNEWDVIDAFSRGYLQHHVLTVDELESLPLAFRLRETRSLFFRLGRYARGLERAVQIVQRIQTTLDREDWLQHNAEELVRHTRHW